LPPSLFAASPFSPRRSPWHKPHRKSPHPALPKGTGANPKASSNVEVHFHGWLDDGKVFDSSYQRGEPIDFPLNGVIHGWTEGMQFVGQGGMIELLIPSNLGYGARGAPPVIPPNAQLHFLVELLDVR
jgi:FKBP-type peptidyl-prolyl cis-trans isomerase